MKVNRTSAVIAGPDDAFRAWLGHALRGFGFDVHVTASGEQALAWAAEAPPAVLFVSAMLSDVLGFEVIDRLRMDKSPVRIVLMGAIFRAYRYHSAPRQLYGADAYIEEGIVEEELESVLVQTLGGLPEAAAPGEEAPAETPESSFVPAEDSATGDPVEEARTLVRIIISDIYIYQPIKARRAVLKGRFEEAFADDLRIGREYFEKRFTAAMLGGRDVFRETLDEFLAVKKNEY
jgi:CheY-like chemotaxis protein